MGKPALSDQNAPAAPARSQAQPRRTANPPSAAVIAGVVLAVALAAVISTHVAARLAESVVSERAAHLFELGSRVAIVVLIAALVYALVRRFESKLEAAHRERLRAERGLHRYEALIERMSDAVIVQDRGTRAVSVNRAAEELYGRPASDILGKAFRERDWYRWRHGVQPGDGPRELQRSGFFRAEAELIRPDGVRRVIDGTADALLAPDGGVEGYVSVVRDITRRVQAEERGEKLSARLMTLLDAATDMHRATSVQAALETAAKAMHDIGWGTSFAVVYDDRRQIIAHAALGAEPGELRPLLDTAVPHVEAMLDDHEVRERYAVGRSTFIPHEAVQDVFDAEKLVEAADLGRPDTEWRTYDIATTPLKTHDGRLLGRLGFTRPADGRRPDAQSFALIETFADLAAAVIERLHSRRRESHLEAQASLLLNSLSVIVWEYDIALDRFLFVSPQAQRMLGYPISRWTNFASWEAMVHPDDREAASRLCRSATERGEDHDFEYRIVCADGSERWVREVVSVSADEEPGGRLRGVLVDIHDLKQAEREAVRSSGFLEMAHALAELGSWEVDLRTKHVHWSEQVYRICGVDPRRFEPTDPSVRSLVHPEDREMHDAWFADLCAGRPEAVEFRIRTPADAAPDKTERTKVMRLQPNCEFDDTGSVVRVFGSIQNITKLRHAEAADRRARHILENLPLVAGEFDPNLDRFTYVSGRAEDLLGEAPNKWRSTSGWLETVHPDDKRRVTDWAHRVLNGDDSEDIEYRIVIGDDPNEHRWIREIVSLETQRDGSRIIRFVDLDIHELRLAEIADRRARLIVDAMPVVAYEYDPDLDRFSYLSHRIEAWLGEGAASWTDLHSWKRSIFEPDRDDAARWCEQCLHTGKGGETEYRIRTHDGSLRWIREVVSVETDPNGKILLRGMFVDIDDIKRAENDARESQAFLLMSQQLAHVGSWDWDMKTGLIVWSRETYAIFGVDSEIITPSIDVVSARVHPDDRVTLDRWIADAAARRDTELPPCEHRIVRPDGETRSVVAVARAVYDEHGNVSRLFGTVQDVTETRRARERERVQSVMLDNVLRHTPGILWRVDRNAVFIETRGAGLKRLNAGDSDIVGQNAIGLFPEFRPAFRKALRGEAARYESAGELNGKPWRHTVHAFPDPAGDGVAGYSYDVTEQVEAKERIEHALNVQRLLLDELDHRVKNTLGGLLSLVDMTAEDAGVDSEFVRRIRGRIHSMATVHSLLSAASWDSLDLEEIVRSLIPPDAMSRVHLAGPHVPIPPQRATPFAMIVQEWLSNALKHGALTAPDGRIDINWSRHQHNGDTHAHVIELDWRESGGPTPHPSPEPGVGTQLIEGFARFELRGAVELRYPTTGAHHLLRVTFKHERSDVPTESLQPVGHNGQPGPEHGARPDQRPEHAR